MRNSFLGSENLSSRNRFFGESSSRQGFSDRESFFQRLFTIVKKFCLLSRSAGHLFSPLKV